MSNTPRPRSVKIPPDLEKEIEAHMDAMGIDNFNQWAKMAFRRMVQTTLVVNHEAPALSGNAPVITAAKAGALPSDIVDDIPRTKKKTAKKAAKM